MAEVYAEFRCEQLFSVIVVTGGRSVEIDVVWCERDGCAYYHESGFYGSIDEAEARKRGYEPVGKTQEELLREANAHEGTVVCCTVCDDWIPDDRDQPCDHLLFCDDCGAWVGPGTDDGTCTHLHRARRWLARRHGRRRAEGCSFAWAAKCVWRGDVPARVRRGMDVSHG